MRTSTRYLGIVAVFVATIARPEAASAGRYIEYLHVEAGSGAAGGGHAAIRLGETTYHYVYASPGLIRSAAEPNESFEYAYRALGNRAIHVSRIDVSDALYDKLADAFARRHITQDTQIALLDSAVADRTLLQYIYGRRCETDPRRTGVVVPRIRGTGYFSVPSRSPHVAATEAAADSDVAAPIDTSSIVTLRRAIERAYGAAYLTEKARTAAQRAREITFTMEPDGQIDEWRIPPQGDGFAKRYENEVTGSVALDVLLHDRAPLPAAYRWLGDSIDLLSDEELARLSARAASLQSSLVRLAASRRDDWGYPMLVGMARMVAIDASLRSGRLVLPDSFDDAASSARIEELLADPPVLAALLAERQAEFDAARSAIRTARPDDEAVWSRLEVAMSAMLELGNAVERGSGSVRSHSDTMLPSRGATLDPTWPLPGADCQTLALWARWSTGIVHDLQRQLREVYHYDVVSRNCVTEIFRVIEAAGGVLGASGSADVGLGFIPFVSAHAVNETYPDAARSTLPSYRDYWLARLRASQGRARTALRESNTITATLRHPDDGDDVFLFYTEEATVLRPLYGALNAGIGAGATLAGLVSFPFDGGRLLVKGARSFVFSVPELAFLSLRKGRNGVVPRHWMESLPSRSMQSDRQPLRYAVLAQNTARGAAASARTRD